MHPLFYHVTYLKEKQKIFLVSGFYARGKQFHVTYASVQRETTVEANSCE